MLHDFVTANRSLIIARTHERCATRPCARSTASELDDGVPAFLAQVEDALRRAQTSIEEDHAPLAASAARHGEHLLSIGMSIAQVVHVYGDICQAITGLAVDQQVRIEADEFRTLNMCLDDAIAGAVTSYARHRDDAIAAEGTERLGILAHELRNNLNVAMLTFDSVKHGDVGLGGSTGLVLTRSLIGIRDLIDRSLADVRIDAGIGRHEEIRVAELVEEMEISALLQAKARDISLTVESVGASVAVRGDRQIIASAIGNLLQNAFKFTPKRGAVRLQACVRGGRVLFDVEDQCGGLPPGTVASLFKPYAQAGKDRSGVGLGLAICSKAAAASDGSIRVEDLPGKGCVFTLDLPELALALA